jgi:hypothetical protein
VTIDLGTLRLGALLRAPIVISLEAGELLRIESDRGIDVRCESGKLWITREEDPRDLWLRQGESAQVDPRGLTLVEAVGITRLRLGHPTPA